MALPLPLLENLFWLRALSPKRATVRSCGERTGPSRALRRKSCSRETLRARRTSGKLVPDPEASCVCLPAGRLLLGCRMKRTRSRGVQPSTDYRGTRTLDVPVRSLNGWVAEPVGEKKPGWDFAWPWLGRRRSARLSHGHTRDAGAREACGGRHDAWPEFKLIRALAGKFGSGSDLEQRAERTRRVRHEQRLL
jgi:hypothetical protein